VSDATREVVAKAFEERIDQKKLMAVEALTELIYAPGYKTKIGRVLIRGDKADGAVEVTHHNRLSRAQGQPLYKHLAPEGYAWLEIEPSAPEGEWFRLVALHEAARSNGTRGDSQVRRFYKGDTVRHPKDGRRYVIRQSKNDRGMPRLVMTLVTETANGACQRF
jgi:hypothetical protein